MIVSTINNKEVAKKLLYHLDNDVNLRNGCDYITLNIAYRIVIIKR